MRQVSPIRLLLIDVDGTLYGPGGVPDCAWKALEEGRRKGLRFSVCTGRPGRGFALHYAKRMDPEGLHIFESGAVVMQGNGTVLQHVALPAIAFHQMVDLSRRLSLPLEAYTVEGDYLSERQATDLQRHEQLLGFPARYTPLHTLTNLIPVVRAQWVVRTGDPAWREARATVSRMGDVRIHEAGSPAMPGVIFASVTHAEVSKAVSAAFVADKLGLSTSSVAMVGDGLNDISAMQSVGLGIAMGNASEIVRQVAGRVVARVEDCGLAEAVHLLLTGLVAPTGSELGLV